MRVLKAKDVLTAIDRFLSGESTAEELEAWADRHEAAEDVEYASSDREALAEALFVLANPSINGAISTQSVSAVRSTLIEKLKSRDN